VGLQPSHRISVGQSLSQRHEIVLLDRRKQLGEPPLGTNGSGVRLEAQREKGVYSS